MVGTDWEHIYKETMEKRWIAVEAPLGIVEKIGPILATKYSEFNF